MACEGGLKTVETFPRAAGGMQSILDVADQPK